MPNFAMPFAEICIHSAFPRVDYRLTIGEGTVELIDRGNAYEGQYVRLVYHEITRISPDVGIYELWSVEVVDADSERSA